MISKRNPAYIFSLGSFVKSSLLPTTNLAESTEFFDKRLCHRSEINQPERVVGQLRRLSLLHGLGKTSSFLCRPYCVNIYTKFEVKSPTLQLHNK